MSGVTGLNVSGTNFGNGVNTVTSKPIDNTSSQKTAESNDKKMSTGMKVGIGAAALATIVIAGLVINRNINSKVVSQEVKPLIKDKSVEAFKNAGNKFVKGKAVNIDGSPFSGTLINKAKDGSEISLEYVNGVIQKSSKIKDGKLLSKKTYTYGENGSFKVLTDISEIFGQDTKSYLSKNIDIDNGIISIYRSGGDNRYISVRDIKTGKLLQENDMDFYYNKNGSLRYTKDKNQFITAYHPNGNVRFSQDKYGLKFYDENGNFTSELQLGRGENYILKTPEKHVSYSRSDRLNSKGMRFFSLDSNRSNVDLNTSVASNGKRYNSVIARAKDGNIYNFTPVDNNTFEITENGGGGIAAKYNSLNKEIEIVNTNLDKESVQEMVNNIQSAAADSKKLHRHARKLCEELLGVKREISRNSNLNKRFLK